MICKIIDLFKIIYYLELHQKKYAANKQRSCFPNIWSQSDPSSVTEWFFWLVWTTVDGMTESGLLISAWLLPWHSLLNHWLTISFSPQAVQMVPVTNQHCPSFQLVKVTQTFQVFEQKIQFHSWWLSHECPAIN